MPGPRNAEAYSVNYMRSAVKDSLSYLGEQVVLLSMFHVIPDEAITARCACYDDVYEGSSSYKCPLCYGTTFAGGVKLTRRVWAMFTDASNTEEPGKTGVWNPDKRQVQLEWHPTLMQGDYVVRVPPGRWSADRRTPLAVAGIYRIGEVVLDSLRQGQVQGETPIDLVGQKGTVELVSDDMPIYAFPAVGHAFERDDGRKF